LLANQKHSLNCRITLLTRNSALFQRLNPQIAFDPSFSFIQGDVRDLISLNKNFDFLIHGATDVASQASSLDIFDVGYSGTRAVLDFALSSKVKSFLLISSGAVYGKQPRDMDSIPESFLGFPNRFGSTSSYGLAKIASEWLTLEYASIHGLHAKIARCFTFAGPYLPMDKHFAIGNFIKDACDGDLIRVNGDGKAIRTYLYAADMAVWLWKILLSEKPEVVYNVGGSRQVSIESLAKLVGKLINPNAKVLLRENQVSDTPPERYVPNVSIAKNTLGLLETTSLEDSILKTANWYLKTQSK
jgi:dTDP-glucose 4,6-dehydratase